MAGHDDVRKVVEAAVQTAVGKLADELTRTIADGLPEPPPPPPPAVAAPAPAYAGRADFATLRKKLFALFDGHGQVEILNVLMEEVGHYWKRCVLFLVKGVHFQPWDARGFEAQGGTAAIKTKTLPSDADTILAASLAGSGAQAQNHLLDEALGAPVGLQAAVPLGIRNKPAAVLYCEGPLVDPDDAVAIMEVLARVTATSIEHGMLTQRTASEVRSAAVRGEAGAPSAAEPAVMEAEPVVEEIAVEPEMEPAPEPEPPPPPRPAPPPPRAHDIDELEPGATVQFIPPKLEPPPAPPAPKPPPPPPPPPAAPSREPEAVAPPGAAADLLKGGGAKPLVAAGQATSPAPAKSRWTPVRDQKGGAAADASLASIPEPERGKHVEAKKIARLLVSEIKLYNEAKVAVGRKNKDLYERLKEDIERSRKTYLDRVDKDVAAKSDYFRDELVATLAEGDASALGMS